MRKSQRERRNAVAERLIHEINICENLYLLMRCEICGSGVRCGDTCCGEIPENYAQEYLDQYYEIFLEALLVYNAEIAYAGT